MSKRDPAAGPLFAAILLLLLYFAVRSIALTQFPPFIDEGLHIYFGEQSVQHSPLAHADEGRLFTIWLYAAFNAHSSASFTVARLVTLLVSLLGLASLLGSARLITSARGGSAGTALMLTGILYIFSSYHFFFERLALADPLANALILLSVYFALRLTRRTHLMDALLCGLALWLAVGFKVTALPYLGIPLAAVVAIRPYRAPRKRLLWLLTALGSGGGLSLLLIGGLRLLGHNALTIMTADTTRVTLGSYLSIFLENAGEALLMSAHYLSLPLLALLLVAGGVLLLRRDWFLPLCLLAPLPFIWITERSSSRHSIVVLTLLLLMGAVVAAWIVERLPKVRLITLLAGVLWTGIVGFPFIAAAYFSPAQLDLAPLDQREYIIADSAGFGLSSTADFLRTIAPDGSPATAKRVIGILSNCQGLRFLLVKDIPVTCPNLNPNGSTIPENEALMRSSRRDGVYVVLERDNVYVPETAPGVLLTEIPRAAPIGSLAIYDLAPD